MSEMWRVIDTGLRPAAQNLALGVDVRYRPGNDIEVDGRRISGTRGALNCRDVAIVTPLLRSENVRTGR